MVDEKVNECPLLVCCVVCVRIYFSILKSDVILTAIYGYHTGRTYEFIGPHICTQYVSITVCRVRNKTEVEIHQEKVYFINDACEKELRYWKRAALESVSTENEAKELIDLAPSRVILVRKVKNEKMVNIDEIMFY